MARPKLITTAVGGVPIKQWICPKCLAGLGYQTTVKVKGKWHAATEEQEELSAECPNCGIAISDSVRRCREYPKRKPSQPQ